MSRDAARQRNGSTPQMVGRYPDYDVLSEAGHWDEVTRRVVFDRLERVPPIRFFTPEEAMTLKAFCDVVTAQDAEPRIPVLSYVDEKLNEGRRDGWQYFDLPDDDEVWRRVARGLDDEVQNGSSGAFASAQLDAQVEIVSRFAKADLHGSVWDTLNVAQAFKVVMRYVAQAFYSHPWAWNEIGFGGPAYPRGYGAFGSPHLGETESWEGDEAVHVDPVRDSRERGLP
jgi:gluconate 2-dehydrogenase subunit 3-like protein